VSSDGVRTIGCSVYLETLTPFEDKKREGVCSQCLTIKEILEGLMIY